MRRTLLFTLLSASILGCADTDQPLAGADESPDLALEGPWIDDPITPRDADDGRRDRAGLGEPGEERTDPWLDPQLPPTGAKPAATGGSARYDFESGTDGWARSGAPITQVAASTAQHVSGRASLAVDVDGSGTALVSVPNPSLRPGATVTFHVYVPAGAQLSWLQPYVQQDQSANWLWTGNWQQLSALRPNAWNTLTVVAPSNARAFAALGVQLSTTTSWRGRIYIDAVSF